MVGLTYAAVDAVNTDIMTLEILKILYSTHSIIDTKSKKMLYHLTAVVFGMVGLTYAAVPLYRTFCQATGYGGTVQHKETVEEKIARHSGSGTINEREIVVQFNADVADGMQWKFTPTQREVLDFLS
ncbi:hypothetical protein Bca4012_056666 [Brassica carinata]